MQKAMSFNNAAFVYVQGSAYRIHFWYMSKNSNLVDKMSVSYIYFFILYKNE